MSRVIRRMFHFPDEKLPLTIILTEMTAMYVIEVMENIPPWILF